MFRLRNKDELQEIAVTVSTETFVRLALLTVLFVTLYFAILRAQHAILLIFIAFFLALALNAPVFWLSKRLPGKGKGSRSLATSLSFILVVVFLGIFIASIVPPLVRQTDSLIKAAPHLVQEFRDQNSPVGKFIRHYHLQNEVNTFSSQLSDRLKHFSGSAFSEVRHFGSSVFALITILVLTFMMLVEGPHWLNIIKEILPDRYHSKSNRISTDMYGVIRGFVNGQVLLAALASILIMPAVLLLHIGYAAGILVIIFICSLIPMIGHTIGAVIVTTVALFHSTSSAIIILVYYIFYMQLEAYIIQPRVQANSTNMSPLLVFASVVIGLSFGGLIGGLVAIPIAGCVRIVVLDYLYSKKLLDLPNIIKVKSAETK